MYILFLFVIVFSFSCSIPLPGKQILPKNENNCQSPSYTGCPEDSLVAPYNSTLLNHWDDGTSNCLESGIAQKIIQTEIEISDFIRTNTDINISDIREIFSMDADSIFLRIQAADDCPVEILDTAVRISLLFEKFNVSRQYIDNLRSALDANHHLNKKSTISNWPAHYLNLLFPPIPNKIAMGIISDFSNYAPGDLLSIQIAHRMLEFRASEGKTLKLLGPKNLETLHAAAIMVSNSAIALPEPVDGGLPKKSRHDKYQDNVDFYEKLSFEGWGAR